MLLLGQSLAKIPIFVLSVGKDAFITNVMNNAIKLAIQKGGYNPITYLEAGIRKSEPDPVLPRTNITFKDNHWDYVYNNDIVLDAEFWQALGKALGWGIEHHGRIALHKCTKRCLFQWFSMATTYFQLQLVGRDTEKFWKDLLK